MRCQHPVHWLLTEVSRCLKLRLKVFLGIEFHWFLITTMRRSSQLKKRCPFYFVLDPTYQNFDCEIRTFVCNAEFGKHASGFGVGMRIGRGIAAECDVFGGGTVSIINCVRGGCRLVRSGKSQIERHCSWKKKRWKNLKNWKSDVLPWKWKTTQRICRIHRNHIFSSSLLADKLNQE